MDSILMQGKIKRRRAGWFHARVLRRAGNLVSLIEFIEHRDIEALRANLDHIAELMPHEISMRPASGVPTQHTRLIINAEAGAIGHIPLVRIGAKPVRPAVVGTASHPPGRE